MKSSTKSLWSTRRKGYVSVQLRAGWKEWLAARIPAAVGRGRQTGRRLEELIVHSWRTRQSEL